MIGTVLCKLVTDGQIASVGAVASFVTLAAIDFERYYAVVYPLSDKGELTKLKLKVILDYCMSCHNSKVILGQHTN